MTPKELLVLRMLAEHGELYGLDMVDMSDGRLRRGFVYATLATLEGRGLILSRQEPEPAPYGGLAIPRRLYAITEAGRAALAEEPGR